MSGLEAPKKTSGRREMTAAHARQLEAARQVKEEKRKLKLAQKEKEELEAAVSQTLEFKEHKRRAPVARKPRSAPEAAPEPEPEPEDDGVTWV